MLHFKILLTEMRGLRFRVQGAGCRVQGYKMTAKQLREGVLNLV
jgi:hypothetical protein